MLFMVIERFRNQNAKPVYSRFREKGRLIHAPKPSLLISVAAVPVPSI